MVILNKLQNLFAKKKINKIHESSGPADVNIQQRPPQPAHTVQDNKIIESVYNIIAGHSNFDSTLHHPTALSALGSLSGFGIQIFIREYLINTGEATEDEAFEKITAADGFDYYFGELINELLMNPPKCLFSIVFEAAQKSGATQYPDINSLLKVQRDSFGTPYFGWPHVAQQYQPRVAPVDSLAALWPQVDKVIRPHLKTMGPNIFTELFSLLARQMLIDFKNVVPPEVAAQIILETSFSMSGVNIKTLAQRSSLMATAPVTGNSDKMKRKLESAPPRTAVPAQKQQPAARPAAPTNNIYSQFMDMIKNKVLQSCTFADGIHAPTMLASLGALSGFACQIGIRDELINTGKMPEHEVMQYTKAEDGSVYCFSRFMEQPLIQQPTSVYNMICRGIHEAGSSCFPDIEQILKNILSRCGSRFYGVPTVEAQYQPRLAPIDCLRYFWPQFYPHLRANYGDVHNGLVPPAGIAWIFADIARWTIINAKDVIAPAVAGYLAFETAMSMARLDPSALNKRT